MLREVYDLVNEQREAGTLTLALTLTLTLTLTLSLSLTLARLLRLPSSLLGYGEGEAAARLAPSLIFARKYSAASRPWIGFHHDEAECAYISLYLPYISLYLRTRRSARAHAPTRLGLHRRTHRRHIKLQPST